MKLYLIEQNTVTGYDTYSDAVVCAESEEDARNICPSTYADYWDESLGHWVGVRDDGSKYDADNPSRYGSWSSPKDVKVTYLGEAKKGLKRGVICSSFHAG